MRIQPIFLSACIAVLSCVPDLRTIAPPGEALESNVERITAHASEADLAAARVANTQLGLDIASRNAVGDNYVVSPYSVTIALSMALEGARGTTATGMEKALGIKIPLAQHHRALNTLDAELQSRGATAKGKDGKPFRLVVSNQMFSPKGFSFERPFLDTLKQEYGAGVRLLDFATQPEPSRLAINHWISKRTESLIPEFFKKGIIRSDTRLVLVNTLYFNAGWNKTFDKNATASRPFTQLDGTQVMASMMKGFGLEGAAAENDNGTLVLALPYDGKELELLLLVPKAGTFSAFEASLSATAFEELANSKGPTTFTLTMPKFEIRAETALLPTLQALGMADVSDFSGLSTEALEISAVPHEAVIKTDESGTEAAAATGVVFNRVSLPPPETEYVIDRPFVFAVRDVKTGMLLFYGRHVSAK